MKLKCALLALGLAFSFNSNAMLVDSDVFEDNDGLAVLDTRTGLEWLDLSHTKLSKAGGTLEEAIQATLNKNEGWRLATYDEVQTMMLSYFPEAIKGTTVSAVSRRHYDEFIEVFGKSSSFDTHYSVGLYSDGENYHSAGVSTWSGGLVALDRLFAYGSNKKVYSGLFLVSEGGLTIDSINDPSINIGRADPVDAPAAGAAGLLLALFGASRKRKKQSS